MLVPMINSNSSFDISSNLLGLFPPLNKPNFCATKFSVPL